MSSDYCINTSTHTTAVVGNLFTGSETTELLMADIPNIVIVHTDDTGRYIQPYGHGIETPNLQRLADEGTTFRNAYCAGPTCSPSRGALLTGSSPHSNGLIGLAHRGFEIEDYSQHLSNYLSRNGFETVLAGQQHEVAESSGAGEAAKQVLGYDRVLEGDESEIDSIPIEHEHTRHDLAITESVVNYLRESENSNHSRPFFLSVGLDNTHQPLPLDQKSVDPNYVAPPGRLPDVPPIREEMAAYHVSAQYVDRCVGKIFECLYETGQIEDTIFIFTTDHGIPFPLMKCTLSDGGTGVSLLIRFPDQMDLPRGTAIDELVSQIDLFPSLCDLLDLPIPEWVEGESLIPLLHGKVDSIRQEVFSEVTYHAAYEPKRSIRTERYRYVRRFDNEYDQYVAPNTDNGPSKQFFEELGYFEESPPKEELYDLYYDPNETQNLVSYSGHTDILNDLKQRLESWMEETSDPLLNGPISKPEGAVADRQDALHPDSGEFEEKNAR